MRRERRDDLEEPQDQVREVDQIGEAEDLGRCRQDHAEPGIEPQVRAAMGIVRTMPSSSR